MGADKDEGGIGHLEELAQGQVFLGDALKGHCECHNSGGRGRVKGGALGQVQG